MARKVEPRTVRKQAAERPLPTKRPPPPAKRKAAGGAVTKARAKTAAPSRPAPRETTPRKTTPRKTARRHPSLSFQASSPEEDALAVEALNRRYYDTFQSLDVDRMGKLWWHDDEVSCIHPGTDVRRGIDEVLGTYDEVFKLMKSIRFALGDVHVRVVGDLAFVSCVENLVSEEEAAGDYLGAVLATNLFERRKGEWRLVRHHASPFAADEGELPEGPMH
jgi:ketosteroid isomerase-like protein